MEITEVEWVQDRLGHCALDLRLDGHPAHFSSSQRSDLLERGILQGVTRFRSELPSLANNKYVRGAYAPAIGAADLIGCTDDPEVFDLFTDMCRAIRAGTWGAGARRHRRSSQAVNTTDGTQEG